MAETNKTVPTSQDVGDFVASIEDGQRRADAELLIDVITSSTGQPAVMWGSSMIGFGSVHLTYKSGRELDIFRVGFAPRKGQTTIYLSGGLDAYQDLLPRLGQHSVGKGCLYLKKVSDAEPQALRAMIDRSYQWADATDS